MSVVVITAPVHGITLATAKAHLRVDSADDDAIIQSYLDAACAHIDGPMGWLGRSIWTQTLELRQDGLSGTIALPYGPVASVTSVKYVDTAGAEITIGGSLYTLTNDGKVALAYNQSWPGVRGDVEGVRIRYVTGAAAAPPSVLSAVLLMTGDLYMSRETVGDMPSAIQMSTTVQALLSSFRVWRV